MSPGTRVSSALNDEPEKMTGRARAYMLVASGRHLGLGVVILAAHDIFRDDPRFDFIQSTLAWTGDPFILWGLLFFLTGVVCFLSAILKKEPLARSALIASATATAFWATGLLAGALLGNLSAWAGAILLSALVGKDLVVSRQPLRSPFEAVLRRINEREQHRLSEG